MAYSMEIIGLDSFIKDIKRAGDRSLKLYKAAFWRTGKKIQSKIKANLRTKRINSTGELKQSFAAPQAMLFVGKLSLLIGSDKPYARAVEEGRPPGIMPPVAPIERWARLKLKAPGAGFAIARAIKRRGIKARPYFAPAITDSTQFFVDQVGKAIEQILKIAAGKVL